MSVELWDLAEGLWLWRQPHPAWPGDGEWEPEVASFAVESRGARVLLDPLAPPPSARDAWERIEAFRPSDVVILKPDHVRDVDLFVRWYGARAYGPQMFWRDDIPSTELEPVRRGRRAPGRPAGPSTTGAACWRRRCISRSSARSCSPTA